jgi:predicted nucleotidyltransferase
MTHNNPITTYPDVNKVLHSLTQGIEDVLGENLVGIYLMGSLTYGAFNPDNSDIDLVTVVKHPVSREQLETLKEMHLHVEATHKTWSKRIECSYVPVEMLTSIEPPQMPRPYFGEGIFYPEAPYGNEWIINQYLLYTHDMALKGPEFKTLIQPVNIKDVQAACIRDLFQEWEPKMHDLKWLSNSHYQSYIILNLCRILYTVMQGAIASKAVSAQWTKTEYAPQWCSLIEMAEDWHYSKEMHKQTETIGFIQFVLDKVSELRK